MAETREDFVYMAKLAEQAERCVHAFSRFPSLGCTSRAALAIFPALRNHFPSAHLCANAQFLYSLSFSHYSGPSNDGC